MKGWAAICRMGGIGDNLIAASVLRPIKRLGYQVEVITAENEHRAHTVFLNNPFIDKLTIKKDGDIPGGDLGTAWFVSRAREYDLFAHLSHSCEVRHALQVVQTSFWWPQDYRRKLCAGSYLETVHDIANVPHEFGPLFFPTDEEKDRAQEVRKKVGGKYVAWVLAGSRLDKIYPYASMAICRIIKELGIPVIMMGVGGKQFEHAKIIEQDVKRTNSTDAGLFLALSPDGTKPGEPLHWTPRRSLTQAMAADIVVTPDTGIAWAVAMESVPKLAMVSHASAENITKHWVNTVTLHADPVRVPCWPCHRLHNDPSTCTPAADGGKSAACMADISVETVLMHIKAMALSRKVAA